MINDMLSSVSISRIKKFKECKLAYKYNYISGFQPSKVSIADVTLKGLVLHEVMEKSIGKNISDSMALNILSEVCNKKSVSQEKREEFNLDNGLANFLKFKKHIYGTYKIKEVLPEFKVKCNLNFLGIEKQVISIFDLFLKLEDGSFIIVDYKTPKSIDMSLYSDQLCLYVYVLYKYLNTKESLADFLKKVNTYIFFPMAIINKKKEDSIENRLIKLDITESMIYSLIRKISKTVKDILDFDFDKMAIILSSETEIGLSCSWCPYVATSQKDSDIKGYEGCPISCSLGLAKLLDDGVKIISKR